MVSLGLRPIPVSLTSTRMIALSLLPRTKSFWYGAKGFDSSPLRVFSELIESWLDAVGFSSSGVNWARRGQSSFVVTVIPPRNELDVLACRFQLIGIGKSPEGVNLAALLTKLLTTWLYDEGSRLASEIPDAQSLQAYRIRISSLTKVPPSLSISGSNSAFR